MIEGFSDAGRVAFEIVRQKLHEHADERNKRRLGRDEGNVLAWAKVRYEAVHPETVDPLEDPAAFAYETAILEAAHEIIAANAKKAAKS